MKRIMRVMSVGLTLAALVALGTFVGVAQDSCDVDEVTAAQDRFDAEYKKGPRNVAARKEAIRLGKEFIEKYSENCEIAKVRVEWLKVNLPVKERELKNFEEEEAKIALIKRFNLALETKNWDEVYVSGKELFNKYPDDFRDVLFVLGTIGFDETYTKNNFKYNSETLKFAKMAIADLEANKKFSANYGVPKEFVYKTRENALGWMNLVVGYLTQVSNKDKAGAAPYLYKAIQVGPEIKSNPIPYGLLGFYYIELGDKIADEIQALEKSQDPKDTEAVAKQKIEAIKAKVALSNGINQRAINALARAYTLAKDAKYKAEIKKAIDFSYNRRFGKMDGLDAWITNTVKQPLEDPSTPITPVSDPEPSEESTSSTPSNTPPTATVANGKPTATTTSAKPATKPQANTKKPAKKRGVK